MSTILHQAVELAQTGRRDEARQLLLQFIQTQPNSEVAWLWLASVAADQSEYEHALNEVLRINPASTRAQQLLAEFHQQYRTPFQPPAPAAPAAYTPGPVPSTPPPVAQMPAQPAVPPAYPPAQPTAQPPVTPYYGAPPSTPPGSGSYGAPVSGARYDNAVERKATPPEVRVIHERKRSGCLGCSFPGCFGCLGCGGCGQGCLIALVVLIVVPIAACLGLSLLPVSLGPVDIPASYLPGNMGRKEIGFQTDQYDVNLKVPRSWYLASANNDMWRVWREMLDSTVPFEDLSKTWASYENAGHTYAIIDVNPALLQKGGDVTQLEVNFDGTFSGTFTCAAIKGNLPAGAVVVTYSNGLCGYRQTSVSTGPGVTVLKTLDPPAQIHMITFVTPVNSSMAVGWTLTMPEKIYNHYADDIDTLIGSVQIKQL